MNDDDDQLRRLLSDAVSDVEPRDRLAEIRASVHPDPQVVPMSRPRPWLYALSGAVASAAVIGVIAYTTNALSGPDDDGNGLGAGQGQTATRAPRSATATATDSAAPPSSPSSTVDVTSGRHHRRPGVRRLLRRRQRAPGSRCSSASATAGPTCRPPTPAATAETC